jgi:hypothetical protein
MASRPGEQVDPDDTLDEGVAARFYTDIQDALSFQIVIMENTDPARRSRGLFSGRSLH